MPLPGQPVRPHEGQPLAERQQEELVSQSQLPEALLDQGRRALSVGDWAAARSSFEELLAFEQRPEALFGLGVALWWLGETEASLRRWESAYAAFRARWTADDGEQAVMAAVYLCLAYRMSLGNDAVAQGWLGRAARLVEDHQLTRVRGWVPLCRAHLALDSGTPRLAERWASEARLAARAEGDIDLELCALSELGAALVELGRAKEGSALLDEAMAGALAGEGRDRDAIVLISCRTITACKRGGDFRRATQWVHAADSFHRRFGSPHLYTTCRTNLAGILFATGEWPRAEEELQVALNLGAAAEPLLHAQTVATLAELRLAQGRIEQAIRQLEGLEQHHAAVPVLASIELLRGKASVAVALLRRRLEVIEPGSLEAAALQELLVQAEIAMGEPDAALARAEGLQRFVARTSSEVIAGPASRALGRALAANGRVGQALEPLAQALDAFIRCAMPLEAARTRLLLAEALAVSERDAAISEAQMALRIFEQLGAARDADAAAALARSLGGRVTRGGPQALGLLTRREREVLSLLGEGLSNPEIGRLFITRKTVEHHVASVLSKLGLSGRSQAAAYAVRHLTREWDEKQVISPMR